MCEMCEVKNQFATVKELSKLYPSFSEPTLRYLLYKGEENGINKCVRRIGKKILFNISDFENWVNSQV